MAKDMSVFRTKSLQAMLATTEGKGLKKVLGAFELTALGIGAIIGTGIFVLTGVAAAEYAGPALVLSFIFSGIVCIGAALCYAELAAMIPVAGSAYTYCYVGLGEIWAWIVGWDLVLEYLVFVSTVSVGWSAYMANLLQSAGVNIPAAIINPLGVSGGVVNLPAILIAVIITSVVYIGIKEATGLNNILVLVKVAAVLLFIAIATGHVNPANWHPFFPFGIGGVFKGAAIIFFAYVGFDAVATAAEEVKNPQRDLPIGIIGSLLICTVLYIIVSAILTGVLPYTDYKNIAAPVAFALLKLGIPWGSALVAVGAVAGITSVCLVTTYGATRIIYSLSRDGLLPKTFSEVNKKYGTPGKTTILVGCIAIVLAGFLPVSRLAEMTNIGTLTAFIVVSLTVMILRKKMPGVKRAFKTPWVPLLPIISIIGCLVLIISLPTFTKVVFAIWIAVGFLIYFFYGRNNSTMNDEPDISEASLPHKVG